MNALRITIRMDSPEARALILMSEQDCRLPREQVRYLLREEARRRGLLDIGSDGDDHVAQPDLGRGEPFKVENEVTK